MAVIALTMAQPHLGKRLMTENRARQLGGIYARHGASVKVSSIVVGPNTGCIVLLREYTDFRSAVKIFSAVSNDPSHVEFWKEREANPSAEILVARDVLRTIHGETRWDTHPVSHIRKYDLTRDKVSDALKLLPKVDKIVSKADVNVVAGLPVAGDDLSSMTLSYQFRSLDHWGEALDTVGTSDEFQALVAEAASLGTLRSAFTMSPI